MLAPLKFRNFSFLWLGGLISMIGNWILIAVLPFHIYAITGSALASSGVIMAYIVPGAIFSSFAGVFVDRWDRRKTMLVVSLLQAVAILPMVFVGSSNGLWLVYASIFVEASLSCFFSPAENALLPTLVDEKHLAAANSLNALNDNIARLVGPAIGGALLGLLGFSSVIILDMLSYILAAVFILFVKLPQIKTHKIDKAVPKKLPIIQIGQEWLDGLRYVRGNQLLAGIFLVMGVALLGDAIISAVIVVFVQEDMGLGAIEFGWMMTSRGLGGLLGGLMIAQIGNKVSPEKWILIGLALSGGLLLVAVIFPVLPVVLPVLILMGIFAIAWIVNSQTLLQQSTTDAYRGRVFGAFGAGSTLLMLAGSALGGGLADRIGARLLVGGGSLLIILAGILAWQTIVLRKEPKANWNGASNVDERADRDMEFAPQEVE